MAYSTMEANEYVCHVDHAGRFAGSPIDKKQKAATALLRATIEKRDFAYTDHCTCLQNLGTDQQTPHGDL